MGYLLNKSQLPQNLGREDFSDVNVLADAKSFVCTLYGPCSQNISIQQVRCDLFLGLTKEVENLHLTQMLWLSTSGGYIIRP